jgi:acylpyruvate hydrolase
VKLLTFRHRNSVRIGTLLGSDSVVDLREAYAAYLAEVEENPLGEQLSAMLVPADMSTFLQGGESSVDLARRTMDFIENWLSAANGDPALRERGIVLSKSELEIKAPVPRPRCIISTGKNFADHMGEMSGKATPRAPVAFLKLLHTIIGPEDAIPYPKETEKLDYEVELAIVIGKPCKDVGKDEALDYVAGYMAFNDISARDVIRRENEMGIFLMGKNFPGFSPMGPYLVLKDEISDVQNLKLESRVNGEVRQKSHLGCMIFKIADLIAYWSRMGLRPGDIITTGTPAGVAAGRKEGQSPWWLKPGDVVEAEVERIGCLRNRIVPESGEDRNQ